MSIVYTSVCRNGEWYFQRVMSPGAHRTSGSSCLCTKVTGRERRSWKPRNNRVVAGGGFRIFTRPARTRDDGVVLSFSWRFYLAATGILQERHIHSFIYESSAICHSRRYSALVIAFLLVFQVEETVSRARKIVKVEEGPESLYDPLCISRLLMSLF